MKRFLLIALIAAFSVGATCSVPPIVIEPPGTDKCTAACKNLQALGCEEGKPLPDGTTCVQFCERTQKKGHWLDTECHAKVQSCAEIEQKCSKKRPVVIPGEK